MIGTAGAQRFEGQGSAAGRGRPAIASITGHVLDAQHRNPVSFASIVVMSIQDSAVVAGQLADEAGAFHLQQIPIGRYRLHVTFMGFESWKSEIIVLTPRRSLTHDAGEILLELQVNALDEAVVVETASTLEMLIDRRVFHVGNDLSAAGGTASELLVNVPSVSVDIDGNVSLRGSSNVQILIDGRPSGMSGAAQNAFLEQIPASSIDRVEVITNPSAKYDPDGMAGILNIILKKNKLSGFHGQLQATGGTGGNHNTAISLNHKGETLSLFSSLSWNQRDQFSNGTTFRTFDAIDSTSTLDQNRNGDRLRQSWSGRLGLEWYPSTEEIISLSGNVNSNKRIGEDTLRNHELWSTGALFQSERFSLDTSLNNGWDLDGSYRKEYNGNPKHFLRVMVRHSQSTSEMLDRMNEVALDIEPLFAIQDTNWQSSERIQTVAQLDFEKPMPGDGKLEWGWKSNISEEQSVMTYLSPDSTVWENGLYVPYNPRQGSYDFTYQQAVHAAYGTYGRQWGVWGLQIGTRLEQVFTTALFSDANQPFENDYFSFYPSMNISRQRNDEVSWIASYSRRVNRPRGRQVAPYIDDSDNRNIRTGNPYLRPEYAHSGEVGHQWSRKGTSITTSLFYKHTVDLISRYSTIDTNGVRTSSYTNLGQRTDEGLEVVAMTPLGRSGSIRFTGSFYHLSNNTGDLENTFDSEGWSYRINLFANQAWGDKKRLKWQVNGMYRGPSVTPQGQFNGFVFIDASIQRKFGDGRVNATLKFSDVFNTREWSYTSVYGPLSQDSMHKRESQNVYLTITWNVGKLEPSKDRSDRSTRGSGGDDIDF